HAVQPVVRLVARPEKSSNGRSTSSRGETDRLDVSGTYRHWISPCERGDQPPDRPPRTGRACHHFPLLVNETIHQRHPLFPRLRARHRARGRLDFPNRETRPSSYSAWGRSDLLGLRIRPYLRYPGF